ncbi:hypothetical protein PIIN_01206 [Serendipita indica DSM 11827]|uniref:Mediator of RNA polymerase II transcription subunit 8 n=1 Tax=Serendipita indica (strain DSM 11827) TaxID=1109443 RepID=G4T7T7_SERID|nr:hypothetical protein PIIN_01206 [Serendipita indica DSM 11827]
MIRNPAAQTTQGPITNFDPSNLPVAHLISLRARLSQIIESLNVLTYTIDGEGRPGMSSWPEILSKYNNLLAQSHNLINTLSGEHFPQPPRRPGEPERERINPFETIALHPLSVTTNPSVPNPTAGTLSAAQTTTGSSGNFDDTHHGMLENLLRTDPHPAVIKRWDDTVRRFAERRKGGGSQIEPQDVIKEMLEMKEGHDARIERALRVIADLRERWEWKMRVSFDERVGDGEDLFSDDDSGDEVEEVTKTDPPRMGMGTQEMKTATQSSDETMRTQTQSMHTQTQSMATQTQSMVTQTQDESMFSNDEDDDDDDDDDDEDMENVLES